MEKNIIIIIISQIGSDFKADIGPDTKLFAGLQPDLTTENCVVIRSFQLFFEFVS